ncbi:MAG: hypothetical protein IJD79_06755 [Clostridia bacterium]|nr:hypothetical protein [Clostridia bacterium]
MNSILYHQMKSVIQAKDVYLGEDAYPYADDSLLIVSDGLGGRGGYHHKRFFHDILEEDKIYDILFAPVFEKEVSSEIRSFIVGSFSELYKTKDYYFTLKETMKCSGYFASRIITAIALYELKYNEDFEKQKIFEALRAVDGEEREALAQEYGDKLAIQIRKKLEKVAAQGNFLLESSFTGAYLLPATLTIALMDETESSVDVLYLWAGDSRAYIWDKDGLAQITEDQEKNEVMTNLITLTKPFRVEGHFASFTKPCLVFNTSDGIYKSNAFESPLDLEYEIMRTTLNMDESFEITPTCFEEAMNNFSSDLNIIGKHDDSNTIALRAFGFADFEEVKKMLSDRLEYIKSNMLTRLSDLFSRSFSKELREKGFEREDQLILLKDEFIADAGVREHIAEKLKDKYKPSEEDAYIFEEIPIEPEVIPSVEEESLPETTKEVALPEEKQEENIEDEKTSEVISAEESLEDAEPFEDALDTTESETAELTETEVKAEVSDEEKEHILKEIKNFIKDNWLIGLKLTEYGLAKDRTIEGKQKFDDLCAELEEVKASKGNDDPAVIEIEEKIKECNDEITSKFKESMIIDILIQSILNAKGGLYAELLESSLELKKLVYAYNGKTLEAAKDAEVIINDKTVPSVKVEETLPDVTTDTENVPAPESEDMPDESEKSYGEETSAVETVPEDNSAPEEKAEPEVKIVKRLRKPIEYVPESAILTYWKRYYRKELNEIWDEKKDIISAELLLKVTEKISKIEDEYRRIKEEYDIREQIYTEYDNNYRRVYRRTRL